MVGPPLPIARASDTTYNIAIIQGYRTEEHGMRQGEQPFSSVRKAPHQAFFAPVTDSHCERRANTDVMTLPYWSVPDLSHLLKDKERTRKYPKYRR